MYARWINAVDNTAFFNDHWLKIKEQVDKTPPFKIKTLFQSQHHQKINSFSQPKIQHGTCMYYYPYSTSMQEVSVLEYEIGALCLSHEDMFTPSTLPCHLQSVWSNIWSNQ